jgi:hypothetical protein
MAQDKVSMSNPNHLLAVALLPILLALYALKTARKALLAAARAEGET